MRLKHLDIRLLPGLDQAFGVDFEPDAVNVVTGPNASGKSSLVRAVRALLYPEQMPDYCQLRAEWLQDGRTLSCERRGHGVVWRRDGEDGPPPRLPAAENIGAFLISSEDLARLGATDAHISAQLRTLLAGGYDLDAVLGEAPLTVRPRPQKLARELARLATTVDDKETEYARLSEELGAVKRLDRELAETADAATRLRAGEDALALAEALAKRSAIERNLIEEFPGGMDRLRGDEGERLARLEQQISAREKELSVEHGQLRQARDRLDKTGAVDPQALETLQLELSAQRDQLAELEREMTEQADAIGRHEAAMAVAARRLGAEQPAVVEGLTQQTLEELEKRVDRVQNMREQIRNLTAELARTHVSSSTSGRPVGDLRSARQALQRWLEGARLSPLEGLLWGGLGLAALIAGWRLLLDEAHATSPELVLLMLIAVGAPLGLLALFLSRWRATGKARADFLDTDIEPPLTWTEAEVEARLERLEADLESATRHEVSLARAAEVRDQLNRQRTGLESARDRLRELAAELGLSTEQRLETGFQLWCRHLHDWQQQHLACVSAGAQLARLQARHADMSRTTTELLTRHGMAREQGLSSRELSSLLNMLSPRMRRNAELHGAVGSHQRRMDELGADIEQLRQQLAGLYEAAGLKAGEREQLLARIDQHQAWRGLDQERRDCSLEVSRLEQRLSAEPGLLAQARDQQRDALEQLCLGLSQRAEQRDQLNRRIAEIHTRHDELLKRRELEALTTELEGQRQALGDELDQQLLAAAADFLIDDIRSSHQADNEPMALARAADWFSRFTRHRYRLLFENGEFSALDSRDQRRRGVAELSTGTRVQLLLAVRLAWIERAEDQCEPLPVFMDEVLTTTDPDRYRAVVQAVQEMAANGRQLFYLTAQTDDARAWSDWAQSGPKPHLIDMAAIRREQVEPLQFEMPVGEPSQREIPAFAGLEPLDWADRAGIGAIAPWQDAGELELFHLLHDRLDLVVELMRLDLDRVGPLSSFLAAPARDAFLDDRDRELLARRISAADRILADWRARHYRPVSEAELAGSGLISENFLEKVGELSRQIGGHPRLLLKQLRSGAVARFRADTCEQLESWLGSHGHLNGDNPAVRLSAAEISLESGLDPDQVTSLRAWINGAIRDPLAGSQNPSRQ